MTIFPDSRKSSKLETLEAIQILGHPRDKICHETYRLDCPISAIIVTVLLVLDLR